MYRNKLFGEFFFSDFYIFYLCFYWSIIVYNNVFCYVFNFLEISKFYSEWDRILFIFVYIMFSILFNVEWVININLLIE